jgi:hypothetical protein
VPLTRGSAINMEECLKSLLLDFEKEAFSTPYAEYFAVKRNKFFANIQAFREIWQCFMALDELWMQEFADLEHLNDPNAGLPIALFMHAHALFRLALEAGFTGSLAECRNLFRMSIEAAYQACLILKHPEVAAAWTSAARTKQAMEEFNRTFNQDKKAKFRQLGLSELHKWWERYSDWGHIGVNGLGGGRINMDVSPQNVRFEVKYFETDEEIVSLALTDLLYASHILEKSFFDCFRDGLCLDLALAAKREAFVQGAERARHNLINRYPELFSALTEQQC